MSSTYEHNVIGRVNRRYGTVLRSERRAIPESITATMETLTSDIAATSHMTFGRRNHRRGNSPGA